MTAPIHHSATSQRASERVSAESQSSFRLGDWSAIGKSIVIVVLNLTWFALIVGVFSTWKWGMPGLYSSVAALAVCAIGSTVGLAGAGFLTGPSSVNGVFLGMAFRMGLALFAAAVAMKSRFSNSGFPECLLAIYLFSLIIDTWLAVRLVRQPRGV